MNLNINCYQVQSKGDMQDSEDCLCDISVSRPLHHCISTVSVCVPKATRQTEKVSSLSIFKTVNGSHAKL